MLSLIVSFYCFQIEDARLAISFELENMEIRPEQEPLLLEMIHKVKEKRAG